MDTAESRLTAINFALTHRCEMGEDKCEILDRVDSTIQIIDPLFIEKNFREFGIYCDKFAGDVCYRKLYNENELTKEFFDNLAIELYYIGMETVYSTQKFSFNSMLLCRVISAYVEYIDESWKIMAMKLISEYIKNLFKTLSIKNESIRKHIINIMEMIDFIDKKKLST
jgi:hypothetical protein